MKTHDKTITDNHRKLLNDTRWPAWRTLQRRRLVVAGTGLGLSGYPVGEWLDEPLLAFFSLVLFITCWLALRIVTRGLADLPDTALDERQVGVRDRTYLQAYRFVRAMLAAGVVVMIGFDAMRIQTVSVDGMQSAFTFCLLAALAAPSCIVAWTEKEA